MTVAKRERTFNAGQKKSNNQRPKARAEQPLQMSTYAKMPDEDGVLWRFMTTKPCMLDHIVLRIDHTEGCTVTVTVNGEGKVFENIVQGLNTLNLKTKLSGVRCVTVKVLDGKGTGFWLAASQAIEGL